MRLTAYYASLPETPASTAKFRELLTRGHKQFYNFGVYLDKEEVNLRKAKAASEKTGTPFSYDWRSDDDLKAFPGEDLNNGPNRGDPEWVAAHNFPGVENGYVVDIDQLKASVDGKNKLSPAQMNTAKSLYNSHQEQIDNILQEKQRLEDSGNPYTANPQTTGVSDVLDPELNGLIPHFRGKTKNPKLYNTPGVYVENPDKTTQIYSVDGFRVARRIGLIGTSHKYAEGAYDKDGNFVLEGGDTEPEPVPEWTD